MDMRRALKDKLAGYKIPQEMRAVEGIPKNAMGKSIFSLSLRGFRLLHVWVGANSCFAVNKKVLVKEIFGDEA